MLVTEQDSLPEEVEAGAAVHLAFKGFDAADVAFDCAAAVLEGEAVDDGGLVAADAAGEGVQVGRSSRLAAVIQPGRRSPWRPVIISANAVT